MFNWFGNRFNAMDVAYRGSLKWAIHHRLAVILIALGATGLSLLLVWPVNLIGTEMLPQTDTGDISTSIKLPIGTAYAVTDATMHQVEKIILANPDVETYFSAAGSNLSIRGTSTTAISYYGGGMIHLKDSRKNSTNDVIRTLTQQLSRLPGVRPLLQPYDIVNQLLSGGNANMEVDIFGSDNRLIYQKALAVASQLRGVAGLESVDVGVQDVQPELLWKVDRDKASELGIQFSDIGSTLNIASAGALSTYYQEGGYQYPIYVQIPLALRLNADMLKNLPVSVNGAGGKPILLGQVATPYFGRGPSEVDRLNRTRYVAVTGRVSGRSQSDVMDDITALMNKEAFSTGMYWQFGMQQQQQGEEFSSLGLSLFLAIALIYMLLASQFESFVFPLVVLMSVPLCTIGVLLALFISGRAFGLTAFIGLLMLVGIAVKNGILLVDYTNQLRARGLDREEAILTAAPTRLRPILMTSSAAILGMLPLALGLGKGSETQAPLATAVVGGLFTSTLLTLLVVPVVYTLFDDLIRKAQRNKRNLSPATVVGPNGVALPKGDIDDDGSVPTNGVSTDPHLPGKGAPSEPVGGGS
jgi:HAE1 family hydrophobic/amphiphilic exporter-1